MHFIQPEHHTRRAFLRRAGQLAFTGAALPTALNLAAMGEAAAFNATDYKALVCVFLFGGNDYANTVVNYDTDSYDLYSTIRGGGRTFQVVASHRQGRPDAHAAQPDTALPGGRQYALHPSMTGLADLFNSGAAAVQLNVGPLIVPLTRTQYNSARRARGHPSCSRTTTSSRSGKRPRPKGPNRLGRPHRRSGAVANGAIAVLTCISVTGNTVFLSGDQALSYQVSTGGAVKINSLSSDVYNSAEVRAAMIALALQERNQLLEKEYNLVTARSFPPKAR